MRYRSRGKTKTKHHLIAGLPAFLANVGQWPEIAAINPGVIRVCGHDDQLKFTIQYRTESGLKCLARAHGAVQEVFLVSSRPELIENRLKELC